MRFPPSLALVVALAGSALSVGCSVTPPPHWAQGGAPLAFSRARWERGGETVDLTEDGRVLVDGDTQWVLDPVGRVMTPDHDPVALLFPEGALVANGDESLGQVGVANASPANRGSAWLTLTPNGQVVFYESDGERRSGGAWSGCQGPVFRTCTLVTHLIALRDWQRRPRMGMGVGVGIGIGGGFHR